MLNDKLKDNGYHITDDFNLCVKYQDKDIPLYAESKNRKVEFDNVITLINYVSCKYDIVDYMELSHLISTFSMTQSVVVYGKHDLDYVLDNKYIKDYGEKIKDKQLFLDVVKLGIQSVGEIRYNVYEDCEGLTYNGCSHVKINVDVLCS